MKQIFLLVLVTATLITTATAQSLAPLIQAHQTAAAALAAQRDAELNRLRQPYLAALAAADQTATKTGNAAMLRAIEQEREAARTGQLRQEFPPSLPRTLSAPRRALLTGEQRAIKNYDTQKKTLDANHLQKLGALQSKADRDPALAAEIAGEKARVLSGINGPISDLQTGLPGTQWRLFAGEGFKSFRFGADGKVNDHWNYEVTSRDKVKVIWDKTSALTLTLGKDGASLSAGDKTWVLDRP